MKVEILGKTKKTVKACDTKERDVMTVISPSYYKGLILLHSHFGFICLNDAEIVFDKNTGIEVKVLPKGTKIKLTVE